MPRKFTREEIEFLKLNYPNTKTSEIAQKLDRTIPSIKTKAKLLGLKKENYFVHYSDKEIQYITENYANTLTEDMAKHLDRDVGQIYRKADALGLKKSKEFIRKSISVRSKGMPNKGAFKKGHKPFNKGLKQKDYASPESIERTKATRFKKGNKPHNTKYDGYMSIRRDHSDFPYLYIRISEAVHIPYHRYLWEQEHGKIPKGCNVVFKDGNHANLVIENLELLSNKELMKKNSIRNFPENLQELMRIKGVLTRQINKDDE